MENDQRLPRTPLVMATEERLRVIGEKVKKMMPKGMGMTIFMFDYGENGNMFYISSAKREDMIASIKEFLQKQENHDTPTIPVV